MWRRRVRWSTVIRLGILLFAVAQIVPVRPARMNPPVAAEPSWDSAATRELARRACFDCHSNETQWPAYSRIAPISWLIAWDVSEGRAELNFSEWQRPQKEAAEASKTLLEGEMPPRLYRLMHTHARLVESDRAALARGLTATLGSSAGESGQR